MAWLKEYLTCALLAHETEVVWVVWSGLIVFMLAYWALLAVIDSRVANAKLRLNLGLLEEHVSQLASIRQLTRTLDRIQLDHAYLLSAHNSLYDRVNGDQGQGQDQDQNDEPEPEPMPPPRRRRARRPKPNTAPTIFERLQDEDPGTT